MSLEISESWLAGQPPDVQEVVRLLLARLAEQDRRIAELEAELNGLRKTPLNSSLPDSRPCGHGSRCNGRLAAGREP